MALKQAFFEFWRFLDKENLHEPLSTAVPLAMALLALNLWTASILMKKCIGTPVPQISRWQFVGGFIFLALLLFGLINNSNRIKDEYERYQHRGYKYAISWLVATVVLVILAFTVK